MPSAARSNFRTPVGSSESRWERGNGFQKPENLIPRFLTPKQIPRWSPRRPPRNGRTRSSGAQSECGIGFAWLGPVDYELTFVLAITACPNETPPSLGGTLA